MKNTLTLLFTIITISCFAQQKEVLLIGTMHTVPKIVKNSYKPLLKFAEKYNPDAIYVEYVRPEDSLSLINDDPKFVRKSDSICETFVENHQRFADLQTMDLAKFTREDYEFMATSYLVKKNYANYSYYEYLAKYGIKGSKKPLRNENSDLTAKLAITLNLKYIHAMDDQKTRKEYETAWNECVELGSTNGDNEIGQSMSKKAYTSALVPALLGRLGQHTNKPKSFSLFHKMNSFQYVQTSNEVCTDATKYWNGRNARMAKNIAEQIREHPHQKNVVIVGAGHLVGIKEALEENYPDLKVKLMYQ